MKWQMNLESRFDVYTAFNNTSYNINVFLCRNGMDNIQGELSV